jgi:orotate phosphoribosyltransferase
LGIIRHLEDADQLLRVRKSDLEPDGRITEVDFDHMLRLVGGLWQHSGDPSAPHVEMTSGRCTDGFVNTTRLLKYTNICMLLASKLAQVYRDYVGPVQSRWVVGSDHAAATFSQNLAYYLHAKHEFTEKGSDKSQLWRRETIQQGEVVLQVEELVANLGTLQAVRDGIIAGNEHPVEFAPVSMTLVRRAPVCEFDGRPILYFRHYDIKQWDPEDCPLCAAGSKRLRPKQHWAELTAA